MLLPHLPPFFFVLFLMFFVVFVLGCFSFFDPEFSLTTIGATPFLILFFLSAHDSSQSHFSQCQGS